MASGISFLSIFLFILTELQETMSFTTINRKLKRTETYNETQSLNFIPQKLLRSESFYNQHALILINETSVKKDPSLEITGIDIDEVLHSENSDFTIERTKIIEELYEPQVPLFEEDYILLVNDSHLSINCTAQNASVPCEKAFAHAPTLDQTAVINAVILFIITIFSYTGNIATLTSILRTGRQNSSTVYMLLIQLTIADLLVTTFCILTDAVWKLTVEWYGGNFLCKVVKFMQMFSLYLSTYVLVLIGFDRLCAVRFPMGRARARKDLKKGIVCIWTISAIFSSPQVSKFFPIS